MPRRVIVTGVGLVSPLGTSPASYWERLLSGASGIGPLTRFPPERFGCRLAAQVADGDLPAAGGPYAHELKRMDRFVQYAVGAAGSALAHSGLLTQTTLSPASGGLPAEGGVFIGVGMGGLPNMEAGVNRQEERGPRKISPYLIPSLIPNMAASMTALTHGFDGPQYTIAGACASGIQALGQAMIAIRAGSLRWALAGGTEGVITPIAFSGFEALRVLSLASDADSTPRPFDERADGMIVGEGAAMFVLEERSHAEARGATILGELTGYGTGTGGEQLILQSQASMSATMGAALRDAGLAPHDVDGIYSQGSGVPRGDAAELEAIRSTFGTAVSVTSIKGHVGHTFAASGPLNLVAALAALRYQSVSPIRNLEAPLARFADMDLPRAPRARRLRRCMINAFGFGGINASVLVSTSS